MKQTTTSSRTTLNKTDWQIIEDGIGVALFVKPYGTKSFYFSGNIFKTVEAANEYLDKIDEKFAAPKQEISYEIPSDYYGVAGRYYGD